MKVNLFFSIAKGIILQRDEIEKADLYNYFEKERPAYLYFVLTRNRITINKEYIDFSDKHLEIELNIHNKENLIKEKVRFEHNYDGLKEMNIITSYPFSDVSIVDENNDILYQAKASQLAEHSYEQLKNKELLDYEVLYIGQSILSENNVPVLDRISNHKTYQKILEDFNRLDPSKEFFFFFFSYKQDVLIDFPEEISEDERTNFVNGFNVNYLSKEEIKQHISLLEAMLIYYFKPIYNDKFITQAPSRKHLSIKGITELDLCLVNVVFGMEEITQSIYSKEIERKETHFIETNF